jgi:hypothetical protein
VRSSDLYYLVRNPYFLSCSRLTRWDGVCVHLFLSPFSVVKTFGELVKLGPVLKPCNSSLPVPPLVLAHQIYNSSTHFWTNSTAKRVLGRIKKERGLFSLSHVPILLEAFSHAPLDFDPQLRGDLDNRIGPFQLLKIQLLHFRFFAPSCRLPVEDSPQ